MNGGCGSGDGAQIVARKLFNQKIIIYALTNGEHDSLFVLANGFM